MLSTLVVINPEDRALYDQAVAGLDDARLAGPVPGGSTRQASVRAGLAGVLQEVTVEVGQQVTPGMNLAPGVGF